MAPTVGKVLNIDKLIVPDQLGVEIARRWIQWDTGRAVKRDEWQEVRKYVFATDTTKTSNNKLPWKNKTTVPKLCQIRDNLHANYMASLFPKRKWFIWEANHKDANSLDKRNSITNYMQFVTNQEFFKSEVSKLVLDYIDYGNVFATVDWIDNRQILQDRTQVGYVGPVVRRLSPVDMTFNPIASDFQHAPKIVRSLVTLGDLAEILDEESNNDSREEYKKLFEYLRELRFTARQSGGELNTKDEHFRVDGFTSFRHYLESDYVEILTFYGDIYDFQNNEFLRNHVIMVVDRHKVIAKKPNPSFFGHPPIFHVPWRVRQDNLWGMGPLDNLVGLQYRVDHIENLKADVFDLITFPPLKITGYVEDFEWGPFSRIHVADDGSDVEILAPPFQVLQANAEIQSLMATMEEMAGSPKEAMGFRTPGEKTKYEVQRLENAASRIFQSKIAQFEEQLIEPLMNAMLELARRKLSDTLSIPVFDTEFNIQTFMELSPADITGAGKIKPVAARHFAEKAEIVQNLTQFMASPVGQDQDIKVHFSGLKLARLMEEMLDIQDYELVVPYIRLSEQADAERQLQSHAEAVQMEAMTPAGIRPDDFDINDIPQQGKTQ